MNIRAMMGCGLAVAVSVAGLVGGGLALAGPAAAQTARPGGVVGVQVSQFANHRASHPAVCLKVKLPKVTIRLSCKKLDVLDRRENFLVTRVEWCVRGTILHGKRTRDPLLGPTARKYHLTWKPHGFGTVWVNHLWVFNAEASTWRGCAAKARQLEGT